MANEGTAQLNRADIEKKIILASNKIHWDKKRGCFDEEAVDDFTLAWLDLQEYYEDHNDTQIGVEAFREYVQRSLMFDRIADDTSVDEKCREKALDAYMELSHRFNDIVAAVDNWLYPDGR